MPAHIEDADASPDYAYHAWLDYIGETYPQFLADDHFDPAQSSELEIYYQRIGQFRARTLRRVTVANTMIR